MNLRVLLLIIGSLLLPLGCDGPTGLAPSELCSDHSDAAIATFEDANLEAAIRDALSVLTGWRARSEVITRQWKTRGRECGNDSP